MKLKPIEDQVVVIMGASSGIGLDTARHFAKRGAKLFLSARGEEDLRAVTDELSAGGASVAYLPADTSDWVQVKAVADQAAATYGRIDSWVHVAAVSLYATFEDTTPEEIKQVVDVNLNGQMYGALAALPYIKREGRGALIHVGSIESRIGLPYQTAYSASKHGIAGFLKGLRAELMNDGYKDISVTLVMPASINTPFFSKARTKLGVKPAPMPPVYRADEVADSIVYAAEHKVRTMKVGGAGFMIDIIARISPALAEQMLRKPAARLQRSDQVKLSTAPDNLFDSLSGYSYVDGEFGKVTKPVSIYSWLRRRPVIGLAALGAVLAVSSTLVVRAVRNGKRKKLLGVVAMPKKVSLPWQEKKMLGVIPVTGAKKMIKRARMAKTREKIMKAISLAPVVAWVSSLPIFPKRKSRLERMVAVTGKRVDKIRKEARKATRSTNGKVAKALEKV